MTKTREKRPNPGIRRAPSEGSGHAIYEALRAAGHTVTECATRIGVASSTAQRWLYGARPTYACAELLVDEYGEHGLTLAKLGH